MIPRPRWRFRCPWPWPKSATVIVAQWDESGWTSRGNATVTAAGASVEFAIRNGGEYAFVIADAAPNAPAEAIIGQPLPAAAPITQPVSVTATLLPSARVLFARTDTSTDAQVQLAANTALQSGTPVRIAFC